MPCPTVSTLAPGVRVSVPLGQAHGDGLRGRARSAARRRHRRREPEADPARHRRDAAGAAAVHRAGAVGRRVLRGRTGRDAGADAAAGRARAGPRVQDHAHRRAHAGAGRAAPRRRRRASGPRSPRSTARGGRAPIPALAADGVSAAVVATLAKKGLVTIATATVDRDPLASPRALAAPAGAQPLAVTLTAEQQAALARLDALAGERRFAVAVLHGVTGSGKTQVYLRLADAVREAGRRVLILVPEIALTPAMAALLRAAFGDQVAIQHSGAVGRRAPRPVAPHPPRRRVGGGRHALGGVRADRGSRPGRRRRGARHVLQAGREPALSRPRRRDRARAAGRRAGRARLGDAVARDVPARARAAATRWSRSSAASSIGRWRRSASSTCARCSRPRGRTSVLSPPLREALAARLARRRAERRAAQPARLRGGVLLPRRAPPRSSARTAASR